MGVIKWDDNMFTRARTMLITSENATRSNAGDNSHQSFKVGMSHVKEHSRTLRLPSYFLCNVAITFIWMLLNKNNFILWFLIHLLYNNLTKQSSVLCPLNTMWFIGIRQVGKVLYYTPVLRAKEVRNLRPIHPIQEHFI